MRCNYHTHTSRCRHATGTDEEYVIRAIENGLSVLGFSCHAPMLYPAEYESYYRMKPSEFSEYVDSLLSLREKYKDKIDIKIGLEAEYYPELHEKSFALWRSFPIDYLILGQHYVDKEYGDERDPSPTPCNEKGRVSAYVDRVIAGMELGIFTILAHPDLINYTGDDKEFYDFEMRRLIAAAGRCGVYLEYNLLGQSDGRAYPVPRFWQIAAEMGARVVLGCDAHSPDRVAKSDEIDKALEFLSSLGITPSDEIALVSIHK